jgi:hypothetical protein
MPMAPLPEVTLTPVAHFPENYFLENLAVRADGSVLITAVLQKELWCVPGPEPRAEASPVLVHRFENMVSGIVETEPDVFVISLSDAYTTHESHLVRIDFNGWTPGDPVSPETIYTFDDERVRGLNGACLLGPGVLALADCFAGLIWRVDLADGGHSAKVRVWLEDDTMAWDPDSGVAPPPQPGVNGVRYGASTGYLYYTSTAQQVFMRVPVDPVTLDPAGAAQFVAAIDKTDDFCVDDEAGFAYVTRHRGNTIDRVPLAPRHGSEVRHLAGDPFDPVLVGPSSAFWGRGPGHHGRVFYAITDGGTTAPPDGIVRKPSLLRVELRRLRILPAIQAIQVSEERAQRPGHCDVSPKTAADQVMLPDRPVHPQCVACHVGGQRSIGPVAVGTKTVASPRSSVNSSRYQGSRSPIVTTAVTAAAIVAPTRRWLTGATADGPAPGG